MFLFNSTYFFFSNFLLKYFFFKKKIFFNFFCNYLSIFFFLKFKIYFKKKFFFWNSYTINKLGFYTLGCFFLKKKGARFTINTKSFLKKTRFFINLNRNLVTTFFLNNKNKCSKITKHMSVFKKNLLMLNFLQLIRVLLASKLFLTINDVRLALKCKWLNVPLSYLVIPQCSILRIFLHKNYLYYYLLFFKRLKKIRQFYYKQFFFLKKLNLKKINKNYSAKFSKFSFIRLSIPKQLEVDFFSFSFFILLNLRYNYLIFWSKYFNFFLSRQYNWNFSN